jgi:small subunit ribosomal protein SAe
MVNYVYKRNKDGIHYLDLAKTWEKLMVAARVIAATQAKNLKDVLVSTQLKIKIAILLPVF